MASRTDDAEPSPHASRPDPCGKCQFTTCSSLHDYSASSCPYNICPECGELQELDAQIAEIHDLLIDLTNKRREVKNRINRRHDRLNSHLPLETVSHIFAFIADESLSTLVMLGVVCKRWREITLGTPQLWTKISINKLNVEDPSFPSVVAQWGSRSSGLPLSLTLHNTVGVPHTLLQSYQTIMSLLRSQAHRWKDLTIRLFDPKPLLDMLLAGLEDQLVVDSLTIQIYDTSILDDRFNPVRLTMKHPFFPAVLDLCMVPLPGIPMQWDRLTHLRAIGISTDALIHVFEHAHNLQYCFLLAVQESGGHYPIPISPVTNASIKKLDLTRRTALNTELLSRHLICPSLEALHYSTDSDDIEAEIAAIIKLKAFLDRSHPLLRDFSIRHFDWGERPTLNCDWHRIFPSVTTLSLRVWVEDEGERMHDYLKHFGVDADPTDRTLPSLRELKLETERMYVDAWDALARLFPDPECNDDPSHAAPRPLETVIIRTEMSWDVSKEIMPKATYARLRAIRESGVALHVFDVNGIDMLGPNIKLTFDETEDESNDEGASKTGTVKGLDED